MKNGKIISALAALLFGNAAVAQMNIGSNTPPDANAALQVTTTNKGLLMPTLALTATSSPAPLTAFVAGMTVYNTAAAGTGQASVLPGFYYCDGSQWLKLAPNNGSVVINKSNSIDAAILGYTPSTTATAASAAPVTLAVGSTTATRKGIYIYSTNGHTYAAYTTSSAVTFYDAYYATKAMGGYLATFTTDAEWQAVETAIVTDANGYYTNGAWIGLCKFSWYAGSALTPDPEMKWITGEQPATDNAGAGTSAVRKMNWFLSSEPNNGGGTEGFAELLARNTFNTKTVNGYTSSHPWNDVTGNAPAQNACWGFIVEFQQ